MYSFQLPPNAGEIIEKHRRHGSYFVATLVLAGNILIGISYYIQPNNIYLVAIRVGWVVPIFILSLILWKKGCATKISSRVFLYGIALSWFFLRMMSSSQIIAQFIHFPVFAVASVFFLDIFEGAILTIATYSLLLLGSWIAIKYHPLPIYFQKEPSFPYITAPIYILCLFILYWRMVSELTEDIEESQNLLLLNLSNYRHLFSIITHDISNLMGIVEVGRAQGEDARVSNALDRISDLIRSVKQIQPGNVSETGEFEKDHVLPSEVVETCKFVFSAYAKSKSLKLKIENNISDDVAILTSGPIFNHSIIHNLLSNAIKFSPNEGTITVKIYSQESKMRIEIIDEGCGVPPHVIKALIEKNKVKSTSGTWGEAGRGLGLRNAFEMAARLGHTIEFLPNSPSGTIVRIQYQPAKEVSS